MLITRAPVNFTAWVCPCAAMPLATILKLKKVGMYGVLKLFGLLTATSLGLLKVLFVSNTHQPQMLCFHSNASNGSTHSKQSTN